MNTTKHIIVFSHGFGVRKDSRGLFTDIARFLDSSEFRMFDYDEVDDIHNTLTLRPLKSRASLLAQVLTEVRYSNPNAVIDLIAHSQGCIVAGLAKPVGIRKAILLAPPFRTGTARLMKRFEEHSGSEVNLEGVSRLPRRDGSTTLVPAEYWKDLDNIDPVHLYNDFPKISKLTVIEASQDEVLDYKNLVGLDSKIKVVHLNGDHNFTGEAREGLLKTIKEIMKD